MKKKTNIIKTLFLSMVCSITIGLQSCGDYLDVEEYIDQMTFLDSVFSRKELLDQYINGAAQYIPNEGKLWSNSSTPFQIASDENFMSWNDSQHYGMKFCWTRLLLMTDITITIPNIIRVFVWHSLPCRESMKYPM